jgi:transposase InsO family protein
MMCRVLRLSRAGYYLWLKRPLSARAIEEKKLMYQIREIHLLSRQTYGSPRIHAALLKRSKLSSKGRVERIMKKYGISARTPKKRTPRGSVSHKLPVAENLLQRNFNPENPNKSWASDITYIWTEQGWLYLAVTIDLYSRKVVGWAMDKNIDQRLVNKALAMAVMHRRPDKGLVSHTDRGSQYASHSHQDLLKRNNIICSMSRKGNCWDNAVAESFFKSLKNEFVYFRRFKSREIAKQEIFELIECFYNQRRIHSSLGFKSPSQYEKTA